MNSMLQSTGIKDKVSNLSDYPILSAATHADNKPTPSHISQRVVSISFVSRQKCFFLMDYLLDVACATNKPLDSRIKAVALMKELVLRGDSEFQTLLQKEGHRLKAISAYMDPRAPGESSYLREKTSSLLEALFEETERSVPAPRPYATASAPQYSQAAPSYNSKSQFQGFGNPNFTQTRPVARNTGIFNLVTDKVADLLSNAPPPSPNRFSRNSFGPSETQDFSYYAQNEGFVHQNSFPLRSQRESHLPDSAPHVPGLPSAVWEPNRENRENTLTAVQRPERGEEGHLERQLVLAFTAEGGIRNKPTRQELEELVARSRSLNCHSLASELIGQLEPRAVGSKLKTLFAIEALYRNFPAQLAEAITSNSQPISSLAQTGDLPVRNKAKEILLLLGIANESVRHFPEFRNEVDNIPLLSEALLVETQQTEESLFDGMLTSQNDLLASKTPPNTTQSTTPAISSLIPGLEDLEIAEISNGKTVTTDMIDFGSSAPTVIFDPLLDPKLTILPSMPQSMNSTILGSLSSPPVQSAPVLYAPIAYTNQTAVKPENRDSFGFISEHIKTLKSSN